MTGSSIHNQRKTGRRRVIQCKPQEAIARVDNKEFKMAFLVNPFLLMMLKEKPLWNARIFRRNQLFSFQRLRKEL